MRISILRNVFVVTLAAALGLTGMAAAEDIFPYAIHEKTLDNGFKVVVIPYDSPGTLAYLLVVRTGSRDEVEDGYSGFAHFFEHMMFRGTEKYSSDDYNDVLKSLGADTNAFTSDDQTVYYIVGPSAGLETMMDIESDRFMRLKYTEEDFRREALAVLGEYNKNRSNPFFVMFERMREMAFREHTYSHTTMGYLEDIQAMPDYYEYSLDFFDRHYRPENVTLLVVGDATPEDTFGLAEKYYGPWEPGHQPSEIAVEPPPEKGSSASIDWPGPINPLLMVGYRTPAFSDTAVDTAALDVISRLLFSESAPLYKKLVVDEQWVDSINGGYSDHRDPYLFTISGQVKSPELVDQVHGAIEEAIQHLKENPVDEATLERTKSNLRYSFALGLDSPDSVAFTIAGYLVLTGDPYSVNRVYEQYANVTAEDIQRVAREIFQDSRRTAVSLSYAAAAAAGG